MRTKLKLHHKKVLPKVKTRLKQFKKFLGKSNKKVFEEMTYCVFAANSSAQMATTALSLLRPVLWSGTLNEYKKAVHKKVRFYNIRSEYLHHNREKLKQIGKLHTALSKLTPHNRRLLIRDNFKGFGLKESSHFLRNIGYRGYCIVDKHVLNVMNELDVLKNNKPPKNDKEYFEIENKIKEFARKENYDIDELDLSMWSFRTGKVMR